MPLDISNLIADDFKTVVDFIRPITVGGTAVASGLRRAIKTKELNSNGRYLASDTVFHFPQSEYATRPTIGGRITDEAGTDWTIFETMEETFSHRWKCITRLLQITNPIYAGLKKLVYAKGESGAQVGTFENLGQPVAVAVNWLTEVAEVDLENLISKRRAKVYFERDLQLSGNHRLALPDGTVLKPLSWNGFDSISVLFAADCEEV